jgi:hypothetical protein
MLRLQGSDHSGLRNNDEILQTQPEKYKYIDEGVKNARTETSPAEVEFCLVAFT